MIFKPDSIKDYLIHLLVIVMITGGSGWYFFNKYLPEVTRHNQEYTVPDLKGVSLDELDNMLAPSSLHFSIFDSTYVHGEKPGKILSQNPLPGSKVKAGRKIYVSVTSKHPDMVEMPNLFNRNFREARIILTQLGLSVGDTAIVPDDFPIVLKQSIKGKVVQPGANIPKYSKIDLVIGNGKGSQN